VQLFTDPAADHARITTEAEAAALELEQLGDAWGAADAWMLLVYPAMADSYTKLIQVTETALPLARTAGNGRAEAEAINWQCVGAALGPMPLPEAITHCERLLAETTSALAQAYALNPTLWLYGLAGRIDEAREAGARATQIFDDLGLRYWVQAVALPSDSSASAHSKNNFCAAP
jgi:hypothetical protein